MFLHISEEWDGGGEGEEWRIETVTCIRALWGQLEALSFQG